MASRPKALEAFSCADSAFMGKADVWMAVPLIPTCLLICELEIALMFNSRSPVLVSGRGGRRQSKQDFRGRRAA